MAKPRLAFEDLRREGKVLLFFFLIFYVCGEFSAHLEGR